MTQEELSNVVNTFYSDKIQMATLRPTDVNFLLFKPKDGGLKEFKGYSVDISITQFETEQEVRDVIDGVISDNHGWYNS